MKSIRENSYAYFKNWGSLSVHPFSCLRVRQSSNVDTVDSSGLRQAMTFFWVFLSLELVALELLPDDGSNSTQIVHPLTPQGSHSLALTISLAARCSRSLGRRTSEQARWFCLADRSSLAKSLARQVCGLVLRESS